MSVDKESRAHGDVWYTHLTPEGEGGIGIFHLSGSEVRNVLGNLFEPASGAVSWDSENLYYGWLKDGQERIDEVVVRVVPGKHSRPDEPRAELNTHSGPAILKRIRTLLETHGATEQTAKQYLKHIGQEGGLDRIQRQAYESLLSIDTRRGAVALSHQLQGALSESLQDLRDELTSEDCNKKEIFGQLTILIKRGRSGRALTDPRELCILGPPNAGKSTLMNTLSREDRSIVHEEAGTTRDVVQETIYIQGYPLRVRDTAGMHASGDMIEREGIQKGKEMAKEADLILWVAESPDDVTATPGVLSGQSILRVKNKEDLESEPAYRKSTRNGDPVLHISAEQEEGIDLLCREVLRSLEIEHDLTDRCPLPFREEHIRQIKRIRQEVDEGATEEAAQLISDYLAE